MVAIDGSLLNPSNNRIIDVYSNGYSNYNTGSGNTYSTMNNGTYNIPVLLTFTS